MSQGSRPDRVADQIRSELALLLSREVHDPGIGFVTLTRVHVSPDLQSARVHCTVLGGEKPCLRRQIGSRLRLKRTPELQFLYDNSIAGQDRIEQILNDLHAAQPADAEVTPERNDD